MPEDLPEWGRLIRDRREAVGLSRGAAARQAGLSDSYWGQVERGVQVRGGQSQPFIPAVGTLLHIARGLRMQDADTDQLIAAAGHHALPPRPAPPSEAVDASGLRARDVDLLNTIAERLRAGR